MKKENLKAIFLVAGHGERKSNGQIDQGAIANGTTERKEVVEIAKETSEFFKKQNVNVSIYLIGVKNGISLNQKISEINRICSQNGYDHTNSVLVSIHVNAGGGKGIEAWYYGNDRTSFSFGKSIAVEMTKFTGLKYRGTKSEFLNRWGQLGIIHKTKPLATLIECGFIDSIQDVNLLKNPEKDDGFAKGIVKGILNFIGAEYTEVIHEKPKSTTAVFKDVPQSSWFSKSIYKAQKKGIINGFADGTFKPGENLTRAQLAVILDRLGLLD